MPKGFPQGFGVRGTPKLQKIVFGNKLGFGIPLPGIRDSPEAGIRDSLRGIRDSLQKTGFQHFLRRDSVRDSGFP